ncbi:MAG TPA: twin-arginine translocase TatA/TatE family subunit [Methylomirabilota bacterium]|nr:twin-arginine translocase TatA/TatE family subunit [Methylomirabilota bacterium]
MFDIGLQELILIFVIALLVFGPKNLPQLGRSLGRAMREFRRASDEFRSTIETNLQINEPDPVPSTAAEPVAGEAAVGTSAAAALPDSVLDPHAPVEIGGVEAPPGEAFVAQRGARLFHARDCGWVRRIAEPERTYFKRPAEAKEAGFQACPSCEPWEPA